MAGMIREKLYRDKKNSNCSRGYAGFYKENYLRSLNEFMFAYYLEKAKERFKGLTYGVEEQTYVVNGVSYKPDFFIYLKDKLWGVVEIKDSSAKESAERYQKNFTSYFESRGIKYLVFYKIRWYNKINKKSGLNEIGINKWKKESMYDYGGSNNPRFGLKLTEESKRKIGEKTKIRFSNEGYKQAFRKKVTEAMKDPLIRSKISIGQKKVHQKKNPRHIVICPYCGTEKEISNSEYINFWKNDPTKGCCGWCTRRLREQSGIVYKPSIDIDKKAIKKRLRNEVILLDNRVIMVSSDDIREAKNNGVIHKNSPLSEKTLLKYFNTLSKKEILNESNKGN